MGAGSRLDQLRRRVESDPASIAFAQLAEEYRRAGEHEEAVRVGRTGLAHHPNYLSARVTLGRALTELGQYDEARAELEAVVREAPHNLAAIRGLAELHQRLGEGDVEALMAEFQRAAATPAPEPAGGGAGDPSDGGAGLDALDAPGPGRAPAQPEGADLALDELGLEARTVGSTSGEFTLPEVERDDTRDQAGGPEDFDLGAVPEEDEELSLPAWPDQGDELARPGSVLGLSAGPVRPVGSVLGLGGGPAPGVRRPAPDDPALEALDRWLAAIEAERETRDRGGRSPA